MQFILGFEGVQHINTDIDLITRLLRLSGDWRQIQEEHDYGDTDIE
jgi:hypothetical protein